MPIYITAVPVASHVVVWFGEAQRLLCIDDEVARVNVVAFQDHFEDFGLVHRAFLHERDDLVLHSDGMVDIVIELHLHLILQLSVLLEEVLVIDRVREVYVIFREQVHLTVVGPGVESVSHGVLCPNAHVLASS